MGDEMGSATDNDSLLASAGPSTPIFTLIGNDDFWSCQVDFAPRMSPKIGDFEFSWLSRRDRVGFSKLFGPAYALACNFQVKICRC